MTPINIHKGLLTFNDLRNHRGQKHPCRPLWFSTSRGFRPYNPRQMPQPSVGTYDFYFDIADELEELGAEFTLAIHPVGSDGVVVFSNVENARVAREMVRSQDTMFRERFNSDGGGI